MWHLKKESCVKQGWNNIVIWQTINIMRVIKRSNNFQLRHAKRSLYTSYTVQCVTMVVTLHCLTEKSISTASWKWYQLPENELLPHCAFAVVFWLVASCCSVSVDEFNTPSSFFSEARKSWIAFSMCGRKIWFSLGSTTWVIIRSTPDSNIPDLYE